MLKTFAPEIVYVVVCVLHSNPEEILLVRSSADTSLGWELPSISLGEFESPDEAARHLLRQMGIAHAGRPLARIRRDIIDGVRAQSVRINIPHADREEIGDRLPGSRQALFVGKNELKGMDGAGYLPREQRRLLSPG